MNRCFIIVVLFFSMIISACGILPNGEEVVSMSFINPTGHDDPSGVWSQETHAYDNIRNYTENYAYASISPNSWSGFLVLTHSSFRCTGLRFWAYNDGSYLIDIDTYYGGAGMISIREHIKVNLKFKNL